MSTVPRLTIGLPVYNGERYLAESLDSLLAQTFEDYETDNFRQRFDGWYGRYLPALREAGLAGTLRPPTSQYRLEPEP